MATDLIPGSELIQIDGSGGIVYFCPTCHHATDPLEVEVDGETHEICTDCFLKHLIDTGLSLGESYVP